MLQDCLSAAFTTEKPTKEPTTSAHLQSFMAIPRTARAIQTCSTIHPGCVRPISPPETKEEHGRRPVPTPIGWVGQATLVRSHRRRLPSFDGPSYLLPWPEEADGERHGVRRQARNPGWRWTGSRDQQRHRRG